MKANIFSRIMFLITIYALSVGVLYAQNDPTKEILVYFTSGIVRAPAGQPTVIHTIAVQHLLSRFKIDRSQLVSAFPDFNEADTLKRLADGRTIGLPNIAKIFRVQIPSGISKEEVIDSLKKLPNVLFAEPNMAAKLFGDPTYVNQWYLNNTGQSGGTMGADIKAEQAWYIFTGSPSVTIAVIDAGVQTSHEDLSGKATGDVEDGIYHGTHVAGIAAAKANNNLGGRGVDWNAQILSKQIFSSYYISPNNPSGYIGDANTYNKIVEATNSGASVLNNSWGSTNYSTTIRMAFAYTYKMNRAAVVSMGNDYLSGNPTNYPAAFGQGIIAVGATTDFDARSNFSQTGNHIDVVAPGGINPYPNNDQHDIWSTWGGNTYRYLAGTSMAAPVVTGIASLLKGYNSNLYNDDIEHIIQLSADKVRTDLYTYDANGWNINMGYGRVNAYKALQFLQAHISLHNNRLTEVQI